jgi:hypothetical protein
MAMDFRDAEFLRLLAGASFGGDVVMPSGARYSGAEITALAAAFAPDSDSAGDGPSWSTASERGS